MSVITTTRHGPVGRIRNGLRGLVSGNRVGELIDYGEAPQIVVNPKHERTGACVTGGG